jgi:hypothetical protein
VSRCAVKCQIDAGQVSLTRSESGRVLRRSPISAPQVAERQRMRSHQTVEKRDRPEARSEGLREPIAQNGRLKRAGSTAAGPIRLPAIHLCVSLCSIIGGLLLAARCKDIAFIATHIQCMAGKYQKLVRR